MPETWGGHELRQYITDITEEQALAIKMNKKGKQWRNYQNTLITKLN